MTARLVVHGGDLLTPDGRVPGDVVIQDGRIAEVRRGAPPDAPDAFAHADVLDAAGRLVAPGYLDLQCNGAVGIDLVAAPERMWEVAAALPRWGVTAWLPTIVTSAPATVDRALGALEAGPPPGVPVARPLGLHLEGPFLSPRRPGAHPVELLRSPDVAEITRWHPGDGVALVTLAPELPGAGEVIDVLVERGVVVAAGHSDATAEEATAAIERGIRWVTHLFNAMAPLHHRAPGLAGAALADERVRVGVIADGAHLHPTTVVAAHRALGRRLTLVTDAVGALGDPTAGPDGGTDAHRLSDGTLAGSRLAMDHAVRNLAAWTGCAAEEAVAAAAATPAAVLGRDDVGVLRPGAPADLLLLTEELEVEVTLVGGVVVRR